MAQDIIIQSGKKVVLSPSSSEFKDSLKVVTPQSIEEVRKVLGPSRKLDGIKYKSLCSASNELFKKPISEKDLESNDSKTKANAFRIAYIAARAYVNAIDPSTLNDWVPMLSKYLKITKSSLNIFALRNIEVFDGATLEIATTTHAITANTIKIHGTGKIVCYGPTTLRSISVEGM